MLLLGFWNCFLLTQSTLLFGETSPLNITNCVLACWLAAGNILNWGCCEARKRGGVLTSKQECCSSADRGGGGWGHIKLLPFQHTLQSVWGFIKKFPGLLGTLSSQGRARWPTLGAYGICTCICLWEGIEDQHGIASLCASDWLITNVIVFNPFRTKTPNIYSQEEINLYCIIKLAT